MDEQEGGTLPKTQPSSYKARRHQRWHSSQTEIVEPNRIENKPVCPTLRFQTFMGKLVHNKIFEVISSTAIIAYAAHLGLDAHATGHDHWPDHIFFMFFTIELIMRYGADGIQALKDGWMLFDTLLVCIGSFATLNIWMGSKTSLPDSLNAFRLARLMRLGRSYKLFVHFPTLWTLVRGLMGSAGTIIYTACLLFGILYVFSCMGFEIIVKNNLAGMDGDAEFQNHVDKHFSSLPHTMLTLVRFVNMDSACAIYEPLVEKDPSLIIYFACIMLVIPLVFMNLVTAVVVQSCLDATTKDNQVATYRALQMKQKTLAEINALFLRLDKDNSGVVTIDEMSKISMDSVERYQLSQFADVVHPLDIFEALDVDNSGTLTIDEFCDGLCEVNISKMSLETKRMERQVEAMFQHMLQLTSKFERVFREADVGRPRQTQMRRTPLHSGVPDVSISGYPVAAASSERLLPQTGFPRSSLAPTQLFSEQVPLGPPDSENYSPGELFRASTHVMPAKPANLPAIVPADHPFDQHAKRTAQ